jgi:RNA polymerase sigma factor (sigma-70 family)
VPSLSVAPRLAARLYDIAGAGRWNVSAAMWTAALEASAARAFEGRAPEPGELERYLGALHLEDLALASACEAGSEAAWEHFVRDQRPALYRAANALDPGGGRELADSLYAELYGVDDRSSRSMFRYFHGRSTMATWLRAILAQRHVDGLRVRRRLDPLPENDSSSRLASVPASQTPDRSRFVAVLQAALGAALSRLDPRERLRIAFYYAQGLKLAEVGRLLGEHEATVSRQLARSRRALRRDIEQTLRDGGMSAGEMAECFESVMSDAGPVDLERLLAIASRKESVPDRSDR